MLLFIRTPVVLDWGHYCYLINLNHLQIQSHPEVLGVRASTYEVFLGEVTQFSPVFLKLG